MPWNYTVEVQVPVYIRLVNGRVSRVQVDDEALDLNNVIGVFNDDANSAEVTGDAREEALQLLRQCEDWPAWEFG